MSKKQVESYIPIALNVIKECKECDKVGDKGLWKNDTEIRKEVSGYLASYGPAIIQSGLIPAVVFYEGKDEKKIVNDLILEVIGKTDDEDLLEYTCNNEEESKEKIMDAIIALKLALRTFKIEEK
ncbi:type III-B CRISPR module-associated protein Cmr5 [Methanococcus voltae]|uniref:CRISPR-associated protein, Cmr5 family n=1 Tax=Methanococcus voltae (strain ATCC BAA-1334 / A3) TaxID=456320 RepID=D7DST1_METV3|nr:type III-B CRISPR module-associated protein Cmr5 [Methanococcus voltae]MCS3901792.1 CRISPR-associated protein Cmr5 [Methanococcus voltae]